MDVLELKARVEGLRTGTGGEELEQVKAEIREIIDRCEQLGAWSRSEERHRDLSRREREVMTLMLEGTRLKEIAARLSISVKTVTTHRARLLKKLGVEDNLGLYRYGIRNGLISV